MAIRIMEITVPLTEKERKLLMEEASLLGTGAAWEALRKRAGLPGKPYGYVKWTRRKR